MELILSNVEPRHKKVFAEIARALNVGVKEFNTKEKSPYSPEFVAKIKKGEKDFTEGRYTTINLDDICKLD